MGTRGRTCRTAAGIGVVVGLLMAAAACSSDHSGGDHGAAAPGGSASASPTASRGFVDPAWLRSREDEYLRSATRTYDPGDPDNVLAHLERAARDPHFHYDPSTLRPADLAAAFRHIDTFQDTSDFTLLDLMNLWQAERHRLPADVRHAIEQRFLTFKYWYTEPTPKGLVDQKWYWSENHQAIFHALELLAGEAFPTTRFRNDGRTGAAHVAHATALLDRWFDEKIRYGFSEWHSDVYYNEDVRALLALVEFSQDHAIATKAASVLDLFLLDIAVHLQKGDFGATHGRSYMKDKSTAPDEDTFDTAKLLFDDTDLPYNPGAGLAPLVRATKYRVPEVIRRIARSDAPMVDRERMGVAIDAQEPVTPNPTPPDGISYDDPANLPFWWERGALTIWQVAPLTLATAQRYDLWDTDFFKPYATFRPLLAAPKATVQQLAHDLAPEIGSGLLSEVNTYTWRGRDAMLSTAQDYRPGMRGDQYHAWQATLDGQALVFTTHPGNAPKPGTAYDDGDKYWTGTASMPRSAQQGQAAIHIYAPAYDAASSPVPGFGYLDETHAFFPTERFDEVVRAGHWTFGRKGGGYVALWSYRPVAWQAHDPKQTFTGGLTKPYDLVAAGGADDVWIVEVGEASKYRTFAAFQAAIEHAALHVTPRPKTAKGLPGGFDVRYASPAEGDLAFGSTGDLQVDGHPVPIHGYPRMGNPFATVPRGGREIRVVDGRYRLTLDTRRWTRTVDG